MTAFSNIIAEPQFLIMYAIAFILLYLGIKKKYEPLLLIPIAFGVLLANFPGGEMGVVQADENGMVMVNGALKNISRRANCHRPGFPNIATRSHRAPPHRSPTSSRISKQDISTNRQLPPAGSSNPDYIRARSGQKNPASAVCTPPYPHTPTHTSTN